MKRGVLLLLLLTALVTGRQALAVAVSPELQAAARACPGAELTLAHGPIEVPISGTVEIDFAVALKVLERETILEDLQDAYAATLPSGAMPEFVVRRQGANSFFYTNRDGQRSDVVELVRQLRGVFPERTLEVDYYVTTTRFFGPFHAVLCVVIAEKPHGLVTYDLRVYACPERRAVRFLGRRLGLIRAFFRSKSAEMVVLVSRLFTDLCARWGEPANPDDDGQACLFRLPPQEREVNDARKL